MLFAQAHQNHSHLAEVETLENEEGRLHLRGDTQLRATPAKLQEEEEESWQDVAADCPKARLHFPSYQPQASFGCCG